MMSNENKARWRFGSSCFRGTNFLPFPGMRRLRGGWPGRTFVGQCDADREWTVLDGSGHGAAREPGEEPNTPNNSNCQRHSDKHKGAGATREGGGVAVSKGETATVPFPPGQSRSMPSREATECHFQRQPATGGSHLFPLWASLHLSLPLVGMSAGCRSNYLPAPCYRRDSTKKISPYR